MHNYHCNLLDYVLPSQYLDLLGARFWNVACLFRASVFPASASAPAPVIIIIPFATIWLMDGWWKAPADLQNSADSISFTEKKMADLACMLVVNEKHWKNTVREAWVGIGITKQVFWGWKVSQ